MCKKLKISTKFICAALLLAALLSLVSCSVRMKGTWECETPARVQSDLLSLKYIFKDDTRVDISYTFSSGVTHTNTCSYVIEGDTLKITYSNYTSVFSFSFEGNKLVLIEENGNRLTFVQS